MPGSVNEPRIAWRPKASPSSATEALESTQANLEGRVPDWLKGTLMRTAPAIFEVGTWRAAHWFDGLGMMFSLTFGSDGVRFNQRLLDSSTARAARDRRVDVSTFGGTNQRGFLTRLFEPIPRTTDNTNVNTVKVGDEWHVFTETDHQLKVDEATLAPRGEVQFVDEAPKRMTMTAHPHWDFEQQRAVNLGASMGRKATMRLFDYAAGPTPKRRVFGKHESNEHTYVHSFALTPHDAIVVGHPWVLKPRKLLWSNRGFGDHFEWKPERGSQLLMFDRSGNEAAPQVFETETLYVFHVTNAFQDGDDRVIDVLSYPDPGIIETLSVSSLQNRIVAVEPALKRLRIKPRNRTSVETLAPALFELPAISYRRCNGRPYRFLYGSTLAGNSADVVKLDLTNGDRKTFGHPGFVFGEPVFAARPGEHDEDDGVVMVVGSSGEHSMLAVLDGQSFEPIARAHLELPIPLGFHGSFVSS